MDNQELTELSFNDLAKEINNEEFKYWIEFGICIEKRRIMIEDEIDSEKVGRIIRALRRMVDDNRDDPIDIYINSGGGSCYDALALYDVLEALSKFLLVRTHAQGQIMSMGFILFLVGEERYSTKRARFMIHSVSEDSEGKKYNRFKNNKLIDVQVDAKEIEILQEMNIDILAERTKKDKKFWRKEIKYIDKYYGKKEAMDLDIVNRDADDYGFDL